jgi:hypothetical protein
MIYVAELYSEEITWKQIFFANFFYILRHWEIKCSNLSLFHNKAAVTLVLILEFPFLTTNFVFKLLALHTYLMQPPVYMKCCGSGSGRICTILPDLDPDRDRHQFQVNEKSWSNTFTYRAEWFKKIKPQQVNLPAKTFISITQLVELSFLHLFFLHLIL